MIIWELLLYPLPAHIIVINLTLKVKSFYIILVYFLVCSLCIRKYVTLQNKCPVCCAEISTGVLRPNRILGEIIDSFKPLQALLTGKQINHSAADKTRTEDENPSPSQGIPEQLPNSPVKTRNARKSAIPQKMVQCPVCLNEFGEKLINAHVNSCLKASNSGTSSSSVATRKPLPKLVYTIMKDSEIKSRLKNLNLSTKGTTIYQFKRIKYIYIVHYKDSCCLFRR